MGLSKAICVFCASSELVNQEYTQCAALMGRLIGERGHTLVFGGGMTGLMGTVARAVHEHGGRVVGVIPERLDKPGVTYTPCDELIVTHSMRERKAEMDNRSEAFIALPGGFGTLEEVIEHLALKQLGYHESPIVFVNTLGAYDHLMTYFNHLVEQRLLKEEHCDLYHLAQTPEDAMRHVEEHDYS